MTQEEKARAYDEALEKAREFHKSKEGIYVLVAETIFPELRESEDEKKVKGFIDTLRKVSCFAGNEYLGVEIADCIGWFIDWLEKQKEQKPVEDKSFKKWVKDYWSHNKVNNPYSYNKGDEIQFDHKGFVSFCEAYCSPQNLVLHDTFGYEEGRQTGQNEGVKLVLDNPEKYGLLKEQKPAEWSEEDRDRVAQYLHDKDGGMLWSKATEITSDILDILRPRPSWKPSENQMRALKRCVDGWTDDGDGTLDSLYNDLKKL